MTPRKAIRKAIRILMLSPVYFQMSLKDRKSLVNEFCALHAEVTAQSASTRS